MNSIIKQMAAAVAIVGVGTGCGKSGAPAAAPQAPPPPAVLVAQASAKDVPQYLDEIGKASALESVTITPRIAGQIVERHFEDGADLTKGQVLFVLDKAPAEASLATAKAAVAQAKASLDFAKIELDRYATVAGTRAISKTDYDTKANAVEVAQAQLDAAEAQTRSYQISLDFCTIRSPIDGRAGSRMVDVGNVVKENETALLSVQKLNPIYADFTVNEADLAAVRQNMADGSLHAYVRLSTDTDQGHEGTLTFLDNSVQDATGTVKLRATVQNDALHFWPGQFVNVRLVLKTIKNAVLIPATATQVSQQGLFVFRVEPSDKSPTKLAVAQQPVVLGQPQGDQVVVLSGVSAGDKVVTSGQMLLQGGSPVMVVPPGPPPAAAGDAPKPDGGATPANGDAATKTDGRQS